MQLPAHILAQWVYLRPLMIVPIIFWRNSYLFDKKDYFSRTKRWWWTPGQGWVQRIYCSRRGSVMTRLRWPRLEDSKGGVSGKEVASAMKQSIVGKGREMNPGVQREEWLLRKDVWIIKSLQNFLLSKASVVCTKRLGSLRKKVNCQKPTLSPTQCKLGWRYTQSLPTHHHPNLFSNFQTS